MSQQINKSYLGRKNGGEKLLLFTESFKDRNRAKEFLSGSLYADELSEIIVKK